MTHGPGVCPRAAASSCRSGQECGDTLIFTLRSQVYGEPGVVLGTAGTHEEEEGPVPALGNFQVSYVLSHNS